MRLGWYSDLLAEERRTFWACFAGLGLDSMDTTIFSLSAVSAVQAVGNRTATTSSMAANGGMT
jgi:hypothetical protein